jgi:hypothetical protein
MITKIDKDGNAFGSPSIIVIKSDGKVKTVGGGTVTDVTATSPLSSTGGTTPNISIPQATSLQDGFLRSGDWTFFNSKQDALVSGTNIKTVNGNTLLGSGDLTISASSSITVGTTPITSGVDGRVLFQSGGVVSQDSGFFWDNTNKRLELGLLGSNGEIVVKRAITGTTIGGIRANASGGGLEVGGSGYYDRALFGNGGGIQFFTYTTGTSSAERMRITSGTSGGQLVIGATTAGARLDVRAQGALSTDIILRTRNSADTRNFLVVNGAGDVFNNGAGGVASNTFYGENSGRSATGDLNACFGASAGRDNTTGLQNAFFGQAAGQSNTTGGFNSFFGRAAGSSAIGSSNVYLGMQSGQLINGSSNISIGRISGRYISSGASLSIAQNSIFIGYDTRANADNQTNQIVIGHNATGLGSNTVVLGNTSIVTTQLRGTVRLSLQASAPAGVEGAIYYDSTTKKHYGHDGTNWNALY